MKSTIWTSICILILSSVLTGDQIVGSFSKGSLAENSITLDRSLKLALSDIKSFYGDNVKTIKPLDVYLQIVAGINYKFIMAYLNKNDASLHINVSIVYSPLETDQSASFQILFFVRVLYLLLLCEVFSLMRLCCFKKLQKDFPETTDTKQIVSL